jgi:antitoxin component YwqK of YwqJK toxin-antitoxin module
MKYFVCALLLVLSSCASHSGSKEQQLTSMQVIDRNGFSETISAKERLSRYDNIDFMQEQPYQKVLRVYGRNQSDQSTSKLTSYHPNGHIWQYLEVIDGRAHGVYKEWHESGKQKVEANVVDGSPDLTEIAQTTWLFSGKNSVWDGEGRLIAEITYEKGALHTPSLYYYPGGELKRSVPYTQGLIEGDVCTFDEKGTLLEKISYKKGAREGLATRYFTPTQLQYREEYLADRLQNASYFDLQGKLLSEIKEGKGVQSQYAGGLLVTEVEFQEGVPQGQVRHFDQNGHQTSSYSVKEGKKEGEEIEYYPKKKGSALQPKLLVSWHDDIIQGQVKTWYENGTLESQKEISANKKQGLSFAWFKNGDLMLVEEYENDQLIKGTYYKKGDKLAVSKIENGKGLATLYSAEGLFLKKVPYDKGKPALETHLVN